MPAGNNRASRITTQSVGWPIVLALCLSAVLPARGQNIPLRWRWSNPAPHGANVQAMAYGLGLTVQAGERGQIFTSEDLRFWIPRDSGVTNSLRGAAFLGNRLLLTGERGTILWADSLEEFNRLDLGTGDWLEGVATSGSLAVAVGDNGAVYSSATGTNWTREMVPFTNWLRAVTVGGNTFLAVGEGGRIATRAGNGAWSVENSGTTAHLNGAAFIGNQFWVVGNSGTVLRANSSAKSWTPVAGTGATNHLYSVSGTNDTVLLAGRGELRLQLAGAAWTDEIRGNPTAPAPDWTYYSALWQGSLFFAAGRSGLMLEGFQTNSGPLLWIERAEPLRIWLWDVLRLPDFYVAAGDRGLVLTSGNGARWNTELVPDVATNTVFLGVGGDTNGLVVTGSRGVLLFSANTITNVVSTNVVSGTNLVLTNPASTLGLQWQAAGVPVTNDLAAAARANGSWVVVGGGGTILTSTDGLSWARQTAPSSKFLSGITAWSGGWVATGDGGTLLHSTDATNWVAQNAGTTNWIFRVQRAGTSLLAVGENGTILTSNDGLNWTARPSGTTEWLNQVAWINNTAFVCGTRGTLLSSTNLGEWTVLPLPTEKALYGVAGNADQLVVAGVEGALLRGPLREPADPFRFVSFSRDSARNLLLVSGKLDQRFRLERSTNLTDWVDGVAFELLEESGTLLILESPDLEALPREFIRGRLLP